jgi:hypothetical protein
VKKLPAAILFFFAAIASCCLEAKSQGVQFGRPQPRSSITPYSLDVIAECRVYGKNIRKPTLIRQQGSVFLYSCQEADSYSVPIDKTGFTPPYPVIRVYGGRTEKVGETRGLQSSSVPRSGTGSGMPNSAYNCSLIPGQGGNCSIPTQRATVFGGSKVGEW